MRRFPALVAAVTADVEACGSGGGVLGVQRTWLDPRRPAKAAGVATPRKALGRIHGLAVRFGSPDNSHADCRGERNPCPTFVSSRGDVRKRAG